MMRLITKPPRRPLPKEWGWDENDDLRAPDGELMAHFDDEGWCIYERQRDGLIDRGDRPDMTRGEIEDKCWAFGLFGDAVSAQPAPAAQDPAAVALRALIREVSSVVVDRDDAHVNGLCNAFVRAMREPVAAVAEDAAFERDRLRVEVKEQRARADKAERELADLRARVDAFIEANRGAK